MISQFKRLQQNTGFTLVELIITIAILAIVAALATPSMTKQLNQAKIKQSANIIESSLREAQAQSIITQRGIKVVLTNTATQKNLKTFFVGDVTTSTTPQSSYSLDTSITITPTPNTLAAVSFTPDKKTYQGENVGVVRMGQDNSGNSAPTGFYICSGSGTTRYFVSIDANNIIQNQQNGSC